MNSSKKLGALMLVVISILAAGIAAAVAAGTPPVLQTTTPGNGASVQSAPTVSATYNQPVHETSSMVVTDNSENAIAGTTTFSADEVTIVFTPTSALTAGGSPYTATATVTNADDDEQVITPWTFSIDTTPPSRPTISSVDGDSTTPATGKEASPAIVVTGVVAGDTVRVLDGGAEVGSAVVPADATTVTLNVGSPTPLGEGNHSLTATSADPVGNVSDASAAFVYTLDITAPGAPTIVSIAGDSTDPAEANDPTPRIVVSDVVAGDTVSILDGTTVVASKVVPTPVGLAQPSVTFNSGTSADFTLADDGNHTFIAVAVDPAGNASNSSDAFVYTLETGAPDAPTIASVDGVALSPAVGDEVTPVIVVSGVAGDTIRVYEGAILKATQVVPTGKSSVTFNGDPLDADVLFVGDGDHTITATSTDPNTNVSAASAAFIYTLDTGVIDPVLVGTSPAPTSTVQPPATVSATYNERLDRAESTLTVTNESGNPVAGTVTFSADAQTIIFTPSLSLTEAGSVYEAVAVAVDGNGNSTESTWTFSVDSTGPVAPSITSVDGETASPAAGTDPSPAIVVSGVVAGDTVRILDGSTVKGTKVVPTGATSVTFNAAAPDTDVVLADGSRPLTATASDPLGNASAPSAAFVYNLDSTEPVTPTITSVDGDTATPAVGTDTSPMIVVSGVVAGDTVRIIEGSTERGSKVVPTGATSVTFNATGTDTEVVLTGEGSHSLTATATDPSGNLSAASAAFVYGLTTAFPGEFHELTPARVLDTRNGTGGFSAPVGPGGTIAVPVAGQGGVPATGASAVVLNVTITQPTAETFLTVFPSGTTRPLASNLNAPPGKTVPNLVVAKLGADGKVAVYNNLGTSHVIYDVMGWFSDATGANGARFNSLTPARILDTRDGTGGISAAVGAGGTISPDVTGVGGVPATGVSAVVLNVTATQPTAGDSFLTVFPAGATRPLASNLNFVAGQTVPNLVMAKVGADGRVSVFNNLGTTHVIFDVVGWFGTDADTAGASYNALSPSRILDTRDGTGGFGAPVGPGGTISPTVVGVGGVPATGVTAVVLNVTVTQPTSQSFLTVFPAGAARPLASNLNFLAGQTVPNLVMAKVGADGKVSVFNNLGTSHVIFDVVGWYSE